jgi:hypothetical protein
MQAYTHLHSAHRLFISDDLIHPMIMQPMNCVIRLTHVPELSFTAITDHTTQFTLNGWVTDPIKTSGVRENQRKLRDTRPFGRKTESTVGRVVVGSTAWLWNQRLVQLIIIYIFTILNLCGYSCTYSLLRTWGHCSSYFTVWFSVHVTCIRSWVMFFLFIAG